LSGSCPADQLAVVGQAVETGPELRATERVLRNLQRIRRGRLVLLVEHVGAWPLEHALSRQEHPPAVELTDPQPSRDVPALRPEEAVNPLRCR
jgi:hypothetical protein